MGYLYLYGEETRKFASLEVILTAHERYRLFNVATPIALAVILTLTLIVTLTLTYMTLTSNPLRAMAMTNMHAKVEVERM